MAARRMTLHHVFANRSNIGDWLSAKAIQRLLGVERVSEHLCDAPFVDDTLERLSGAPASEPVVIGGGGLFMDYFEPFWDGFRRIGKHRTYAIWGVGCCDMKRRKSRLPPSLLSEIVSDAAFVSVRDPQSAEIIGPERVGTPAMCPCINLLKPSSAAPRHLLYADAYDNIGADAYTKARSICQRAAAKRGLGYVQTNNIVEKDRCDELETLLGRYAEASLVVASRLHGCIIGLAMGKRTIAISGDEKVDSFMRMAGLGDWVADRRDVDILEHLIDRSAEQPSVSATLAIHARRNAEIAQRLRASLGLPTDLA